MLNVVFSNPVVSCFVVVESVIYYGNTIRLKRVTFIALGLKRGILHIDIFVGKNVLMCLIQTKDIFTSKLG